MDSMAVRRYTSNSEFLSGMAKSIPPMNELFDMAGMELPTFLGKEKSEDVPAVEVEMEAVNEESVNTDEAK